MKVQGEHIVLYTYTHDASDERKYKSYNAHSGGSWGAAEVSWMHHVARNTVGPEIGDTTSVARRRVFTWYGPRSTYCKRRSCMVPHRVPCPGSRDEAKCFDLQTGPGFPRLDVTVSGIPAPPPGSSKNNTHHLLFAVLSAQHSNLRRPTSASRPPRR